MKNILHKLCLLLAPGSWLLAPPVIAQTFPTAATQAVTTDAYGNLLPPNIGLTATASSGSTMLIVSSGTGLSVGAFVSGTGIAASTTISAVSNSSTISLSAATTATLAGGALNITGTLASTPTSSINLSQGTTTLANTIRTVSGSITVTSGSNSTLSGSSTLTLQSNGTLNINGGTIVGSGTLTYGSGGTLGSAAFDAASVFLQTSNNLSDLGSATTARTNLGLGTAATSNSSAFLTPGNNLSDVGSASTARTNLGLGTAATSASSAFLTPANNLSDVGSASTARTNLGLGSSATDAVATATTSMQGTSSSTLISPLFEALARSNNLLVLDMAGAENKTAVGTGNGSINQFASSTSNTYGTQIYLTTGATSASSELWSFSRGNDAPGSSNNYNVNWSLPLKFTQRLALNAGGETLSASSGLFRAGVGSGVTSSTAGTIGSHGVCFEVRGTTGEIWLVTNNGSTTTSVDSTVALSNSTDTIMVTSDGAGNLTLYVDGVSRATTAAGPTSGAGYEDTQYFDFICNATTSSTSSLMASRLVVLQTP